MKSKTPRQCKMVSALTHPLDTLACLHPWERKSHLTGFRESMGCHACMGEEQQPPLHCRRRRMRSRAIREAYLQWGHTRRCFYSSCSLSFGSFNTGQREEFSETSQNFKQKGASLWESIKTVMEMLTDTSEYWLLWRWVGSLCRAVCIQLCEEFPFIISFGGKKWRRKVSFLLKAITKYQARRTIKQSREICFVLN